MKKFIMALVCLMTMVVLTSCGSTYEVSANYDVCWPDGTRSYTFENTYTNSTKPTVSCYSISGTNYVSIHSAIDDWAKNPMGRVIESSTAPIRLISWSVKPTKKVKNKNRCAKVLKNGERCSNMAEYDSRYCWKHD